MRWRVIVLGLTLTTVLVAPTRAQQPDLHRAGLVVVHGNGRVVSACVAFSEESISGAELLRRSGLGVTLTAYGGLGYGVCAISGEGCSAGQDCFCQCRGNPCAYWVYSHRRPDGSWAVSGVGASGWEVHDDDVDGWVWGDGSTAPPLVTLEQVCQPDVAQPAAPTVVPEFPPPTITSAPFPSLTVTPPPSPIVTSTPLPSPVLPPPSSSPTVQSVAAPSPSPSSTTQPSTTASSSPSPTSERVALAPPSPSPTRAAQPTPTPPSSSSTLQPATDNQQPASSDEHPTSTLQLSYTAFGLIVIGLLTWLVFGIFRRR